MFKIPISYQILRNRLEKLLRLKQKGPIKFYLNSRHVFVLSPSSRKVIYPTLICVKN